MDAAKVQLSKEELALVSDPGWILTKNSIMVRVVELLAGLGERSGPGVTGLQDYLSEVFELSGNMARWGELPPNWATPKISKGENYLGLPYVILDHPRLFGREDVLAVRTMFWWGHYFSVTLHLKGRYQDLFLPVITGHLRKLMDNGFHIAISEDEWRHEVEVDNYKLLEEDGMLIAEGHPFLKLSAKVPLDKWNSAPDVLLELNQLLIRMLMSVH